MPPLIHCDDVGAFVLKGQNARCRTNRQVQGLPQKLGEGLPGNGEVDLVGAVNAELIHGGDHVGCGLEVHRGSDGQVGAGRLQQLVFSGNAHVHGDGGSGLQTLFRGGLGGDHLPRIYALAGAGLDGGVVPALFNRGQRLLLGLSNHIGNAIVLRKGQDDLFR